MISLLDWEKTARMFDPLEDQRLLYFQHLSYYECFPFPGNMRNTYQYNAGSDDTSGIGRESS